MFDNIGRAFSSYYQIIFIKLIFSIFIVFFELSLSQIYLFYQKTPFILYTFIFLWVSEIGLASYWVYFLIGLFYDFIFGNNLGLSTICILLIVPILALAKTNILNHSSVSRLITMNTYYDTESFEIALPRDLHNDGLDRFSLGICPGCFNSSVQDVKYRMSLAQKYNVRHIAYWAGSKIPDVWLNEIRRWKSCPLK